MPNQQLSVQLAYRGGSVEFKCCLKDCLLSKLIANIPPAAEAGRSAATQRNGIFLFSMV